MPHAWKRQSVLAAQLDGFSKLAGDQGGIFVNLGPAVTHGEIRDFVGDKLLEGIMADESPNFGSVRARSRPLCKRSAGFVPDRGTLSFVIINFFAEHRPFRICGCG